MRIFLPCLLLFITSSIFAQRRYFDKIFTSFQTDTALVYGENYVFDVTQGEAGLTQEEQTLDIYYPPVSDTVKNRPLIIWAHGGSFLNGSKNDPDIVYFCNEYAKRGFVCASINYRLGFESLDSVAVVRAVYRALQDGRASIRYMRSVADNYDIDTNRIYFGGTSAGGFIALNMAYINLPEEVPNYIDTSARLAINEDPRLGLDGIEGLTNTIDEPSTFHGIINFCGATKELEWMDDAYSRSLPIISMHGTEDGTVPYATRVINLNDIAPIPEEPKIPIVKARGSYDIDQHADSMGYSSKFYTWYGADHVPYINFLNSDTAQMYMDTLMSFTTKFIYEDFLGLGPVEGIGENEPPCDFNAGEVLPCQTSGVEFVKTQDFQIYPNPATDVVTISHRAGGGDFTVSLIDVAGNIVQAPEELGREFKMDLSKFTPGLYYIKLSSNLEQSTIKKLMIQ